MLDPLRFSCSACPAQIGQWCDDGWPMHSEFVQTVGFTHEQRTSYNLLANQLQDGAEPDKDAFDASVLNDGRLG